MSTRPRQIQGMITSLLEECPLVKNVESLGSLSHATDDAYSDVDLRVCVNDLPGMIVARHQVLGKSFRAETEWIVHLRSDSFCSTLLLAEESCYHKVDLEFFSDENISLQELHTQAFSGECPAGLYLPTPGITGHFLVGQLLGGTRYAKARKRGQDLTCWRFCSSMVDWLCTLLYEQGHGWLDLHRKLNTEEYTWLDSVLDSQIGLDIRAALDFSSPNTMNTAVAMLLDRMIELSMQKGTSLGNPVPRAPILRLAEFLRSELTANGSNVQQVAQGNAINRAP